MKIACEACGAKYTIADDKVRGRKVKIRCKGCGTPIVVDGQQGGEPSGAEVESDAALEPADGPVIWSVNLSDTDSRTMTVDEIVAGYSSGLVTADAFVWKDGMTDWVAVLESELAPFLQGAPAPTNPPAAAPAAPAAAPVVPAVAPLAPVAAAPSTTAPAAVSRGAIPQFAAPNLGAAPAGSASRPAAAARPAARAQAQPDNTQDLFGGIDAAGADEDEVATSAPFVPQAGSSAYDDGKMTGARNENSVLFSLDALKAGFSPSAPAANAKPAPKAPKGPSGGRPQQPSNPDDPFGMGASAGLGGMGGGALFGADNHALLTAPAPPPPPPPPTPAQLASGAPMYAAPPKNKLVLIGGGIGGVVIIGLLAALVFGNKHEAGPGTEGSALTNASAAPEKAAAAKKEETPPAEDKPAESAAASASASPSASAAASASASAKPADKPVAVAVKTDAAKKPKEEAPPPADAPPFSKASAISALSAAAAGASSCKKPGGPTGSGKATVTFAPSGRATTATVAGSFAGTPVGGCVASVFRRAHVPAFSGSSVTVSKSFSIN